MLSVGIFDYQYPDKDIFSANNYCINPTICQHPCCCTTQEGVRWQDCSYHFALVIEIIIKYLFVLM